MNGPTSKSRSERANACRLGRRRNGFFRAALARVAGLSLLIGAVIATTIPTATGAAEKQRPEPPSVGAQAPEIAFVASDGKEHKLSEFRGRPVMLFLFASWCPTCVYGTQELARQFNRHKEAGLQIIQLRLYKNLGYPGPSMADFAKENAKGIDGLGSWLWGEASREVSFTYDPWGYPDIYFLIDGDGTIHEINTAPEATIDSIIKFAQGTS